VTVAQVPTAFTGLEPDGTFELDLRGLANEVSLLAASQQFLVFKVRDQNGAPLFESPRYPIDSVRVWLRERPDKIPIQLSRTQSNEPGLEGEPPEVIQHEGPIRDG